MSQTPRVGSLEIGQDLKFTWRQWRVQRAAWAVMALILLLGLIGLLGGGPFSQAEASSGSLALQHDRFMRKRAPSELQLQLNSGVALNGEASIWLAESFLNKVDIVRIEPEPTEMEAAADRAVYRFTIADPAQPAVIVFQVEPNQPGIVEGRLGLVGAEEIAFRQFIYP